MFLANFQALTPASFLNRSSLVFAERTASSTGMSR